jgi:DNA polymerase-3 subunit delta
VDKLALLNPPGRLELAAALESVADNARYGLFDLADAMLGGDARAVVRMMDGLREEGTATPLVVWMLAEEVRRLLALAEAQAGGEPLEPRIARIYPQPRQALYRRALGRLRLNALRGLLVACARADRIVKSRPLRSQWAELLDLALCVAGETSPGQRARRTAAALAEPIPE